MLVHPFEVYFEAAAVIITLVLLGQVLELRARRRTSSAIRDLLSLAPPTARIVRNGTEQEVALAEVRSGDLLGAIASYFSTNPSRIRSKVSVERQAR